MANGREPGCPEPLSIRAKAWSAVALAWAAGFSDIVIYQAVDHVFTANITGDTAEMSMHAATGSWSSAAARGWPVLIFILGVLMSSAILEFSRRRGIRSSAALSLGLEVGLILAFVLAGNRLFLPASRTATGSGLYYLFVALGACAFGFQSGTIRQVGKTRIHTTYITGTLTKLGESAAEFLFWFADELRAGVRSRIGPTLRSAYRQSSARRAVLMAGLWLGFAAGALSGVSLRRYWSLGALFVPAGVVAAFAILDLFRPVSASAEFGEG
jgi:uncharacterized membrane protein YoaK (UPF0700 family)